MNTRKFIAIIGILAVLLIIFLIFGAIFGNDETKPGLLQTIQTNQDTVTISELATEKATNYNVRVLAANTAATATSEIQQLSTYYEMHHGKLAKRARQTADNNQLLKQLEDALAIGNFDTEYKSLLQTQLESNVSRLQTLSTLATRQELKDLLQTAISNHQIHLEQLKNL